MLEPILIDTAAFTQNRQKRDGEIALSGMDYRVFSHELLFDAEREKISYRCQGDHDKFRRPFVDIEITGSLTLICQRCTHPVDWLIQDESSVTLFMSEQQLDDAMVADESLEGMVWVSELNLLELIEDQLLMALPYSPTHEVCEHANEHSLNTEKTNPFALLANVKNK